MCYLYNINSDKNVDGVIARQSLEQSILRITARDCCVLYIRWKWNLIDLERTLQNVHGRYSMGDAILLFEGMLQSHSLTCNIFEVLFYRNRA